MGERVKYALGETVRPCDVATAMCCADRHALVTDCDRLEVMRTVLEESGRQRGLFFCVVCKMFGLIVYNFMLFVITEKVKYQKNTVDTGTEF